jgi:hypothetical protein
MDALSLGAAFPTGADTTSVLLPGLPIAGAAGQQVAQQLHAAAADAAQQQAAGVSVPFLTQEAAQQAGAGAALPSFLMMPNWPRTEVSGLRPRPCQYLRRRPCQCLLASHASIV